MFEVEHSNGVYLFDSKLLNRCPHYYDTGSTLFAYDKLILFGNPIRTQVEIVGVASTIEQETYAQ